MPTFVVHVMPKPELLDPQGKAIRGVLARNGFEVSDARQGKRFEIRVDGPVTDQLHEKVRQVAADILANGVIEDVVGIEVLD